jgi:hypothetical protein
MPRLIVDLSARSEIIREEPYDLHFWEMTPREALAFLRDPRKMLSQIGIQIPAKCRVETVIENHDWISEATGGFAKANGTIVCNVGGGNVARDVYRISMYGHRHEDVGRFRKKLLHSPDEQEQRAKRR